MKVPQQVIFGVGLATDLGTESERWLAATCHYRLRILVTLALWKHSTHHTQPKVPQIRSTVHNLYNHALNRDLPS